jgi:hypothetical protein
VEPLNTMSHGFTSSSEIHYIGGSTIPYYKIWIKIGTLEVIPPRLISVIKLTHQLYKDIHIYI